MGKVFFALGFLLLCLVTGVYLQSRELALHYQVLGLMGAGLLGVGIGSMASEVSPIPFYPMFFILLIFMPPLFGAFALQDTQATGTIFVWFICGMIGSVMGWAKKSLRMPTLRLRLTLPRIKSRVRISSPAWTFKGATTRARRERYKDLYERDLEQWDKFLKQLKKRYS